jgi:hypothetical protein
MLEREANTTAKLRNTLIACLVSNNSDLIAYLDVVILNKILAVVALSTPTRIASVYIDLAGSVAEEEVTIVVIVTLIILQ